MSNGATQGIYCLANDGIIDGLAALCNSLRRHCPQLPVTVIPYDDQLTETRRVLDHHGYRLFEDASLARMDALGLAYWPGQTRRAHIMRKFCAFWGEYERFLFLDADIVVLRDLAPYFRAFGEEDLMYFATDLDNVYRPGAWRDQMVADYQTAGFNSGVFMGRSDRLRPERLEQMAVEAGPLRDQFVDNLEQTFINYVADMSHWSMLDAHQAVPDLVDASALMRLRRAPEGVILDDVRVPTSGRPVTLLHWAGHDISPYMPYRSLFLDYRLPGAGRRARARYQVNEMIERLGTTSVKTPVRLVRRGRELSKNALASRGLVSWP